MQNSVRRTPPVARPTELSSSAVGSSTFGIKIVKPGVRAQVYSPSWNGTETIIRPYPCLSYDNPDEFEPYFNVQGGRFGNWIRRYDCAWKVGKGQNKRTFLIANTENSDYFDVNKSPLAVMYNNLYKIRKDTKAISQCLTLPSLFEGEAGGAAPLTRPKSLYLIQGVLLVHGSKLKYGPDDRTGQNRPPLGVGDAPSCVFMIPGGSLRGESSAAGKVLLNMLNEENENFNDQYDFETRFKYGDIVHPDHGRFIVFRQANVAPAGSQLARPQSGGRAGGGLRNSGGPSGFRSAAQNPVQGYDVEITNLPLLDGTTPRFNNPDDIQDMKSHWLYWEEALYFPNFVEQARELNEIFDPVEIVMAFSGCDPDWITDETWKKYKGSNTMRAETPAHVAYAPPARQPAQASSQSANPSRFSRTGYVDESPAGELPTTNRAAYVEASTAGDYMRKAATPDGIDDPFGGSSLDNIRDTGRATFSGGRVVRNDNADVIAPSKAAFGDDEEDSEQEIEGFFSKFKK